MNVTPALPTAELVEKSRDPAATLREQHAAFARLVEQSQHLVFGLAMASLRNAEEARDAAQEAFTTAWVRLRQLRDPAAFEAWLKTILATRCNRRRRRRTCESAPAEPPQMPEPVKADRGRSEYPSLVAAAVATLPEGERHVTALFYFLGHSQREIARMLHLKPGTVGKRLHSARLRIRRSLPASVRGEFVRLRPSRTFVESVRLGLFDEYVGEYRFARRPDLVVSIVRQGDSLISEDGQQRNVLVSLAEGSLLTSHYDGEGRFGRDRHGRISSFAYYEFGKRLGVARKVDAGLASSSAGRRAPRRRRG